MQDERSYLRILRTLPNDALKLYARLTNRVTRHFRVDKLKYSDIDISLADFQLRTGLGKPMLRQLSLAGALNGLAKHRRDAMWQIETLRATDDLFGTLSYEEVSPPLEAMSLFERMQSDYRSMGMTAGPNPMAYVRNEIKYLMTSEDLKIIRTGRTIEIAGLIICKQHPETAKGFVFLSLEDEAGIANIIITPQLYSKYDLTVTQEKFLLIKGEVQNAEGVIHIKAKSIKPFYFPKVTTPAPYNYQHIATPPSHDFR